MVFLLATKCLEQTACVMKMKADEEAKSVTADRIEALLAADVARQTELCKSGELAVSTRGN